MPAFLYFQVYGPACSGRKVSFLQRRYIFPILKIYWFYLPLTCFTIRMRPTRELIIAFRRFKRFPVQLLRIVFSLKCFLAHSVGVLIGFPQVIQLRSDLSLNFKHLGII